MTDKPDKSLEEIIYEHYRLAWSKGEFPNGLEVTSKIVADAIRQWIRDELNKLEQYDYKYNEFFFKVSDVRKALGVEDEEKVKVYEVKIKCSKCNKWWYGFTVATTKCFNGAWCNKCKRLIIDEHTNNP